ncbi:MAG: hypothetical protein HKN87_23090 [Saprospiraceae bacterium]|nr:hypothetical protein [Saprospiraceae bacterium]
MMKYFTILCMSFLLLGGVSVFAQDEENTEDEYYEDDYSEDDYYEDDYSGEEYYDEAADLSEDIVRKSEFMIPSTPAFALLGVTPEMVTRPGTVQDFKVDWRLKNYNLAPDLALEAQPLWFLYFDRKGLDAYRKATPFVKTLSTLSLSFGTAKMDGLNHFAYGVKMNLYRERDPVSDPVLLQEMAVELAQMEEPLKLNLEQLQTELDSTQNREDRILMREQIFDVKRQLNDVRRAQKLKLIETQQNYMQENWNSDMLDVAFGKVSTFNNALDSLNIESAGYGFWLNGAKGLGRNGLLTGIFKIRQVGENTDLMVGASYRFGGARFSFYGELVYESLRSLSENGFADDELFAGKYSEDLGNGWARFNEALVGVSRWNLTYGGDFRLSNGILLNFSLRTKLDETLKFRKLLPVANVTCLMR